MILCWQPLPRCLMTLFAILLTLFILAGSVLGWVAFLRIRTLTG